MTVRCAICGEPDRLGEVGYRGWSFNGEPVQTCNRHDDPTKGDPDGSNED